MADAMKLVGMLSLEHEVVRKGYNNLIDRSLYKNLLTQGTLRDSIDNLRKEIEKMVTNLGVLSSLIKGKNQISDSALAALLRWAESLLEVNVDILDYILSNSADQIEVRLGRCLSSCMDTRDNIMTIANILEGKPANAARVWPIR